MLKASSESFTTFIRYLETYQQTPHESCYNETGTTSVFRLNAYNLVIEPAPKEHVHVYVGEPCLVLCLNQTRQHVCFFKRDDTFRIREGAYCSKPYPIQKWDTSKKTFQSVKLFEG